MVINIDFMAVSAMVSVIFALSLYLFVRSHS